MLAIPVAGNIIKTIIEHQESIIGPLAFEQANKVDGLRVTDGGSPKVEITGKNPSAVLTNLVERYEELFGLASVEVCRDAVKEVKPAVSSDELPEILR